MIDVLRAVTSVRKQMKKSRVRCKSHANYD